ncbi:NfeD family protein [Pseudomonas sp. PCH446]
MVSGDAGLEGSLTPVTALKADDAYAGWVQLQGENWQVLSPTPLHTGQQVRVIARKGLLLEVKAVDDPPRRGD